MAGKRFSPGRIAKLILVNCLVLVFLLALVLGAMEIYLHVVVPGSSGGSIFEYTLETERYKVLKKNASIVAYGVELRTNADGYRDHRPSFPPKGPDTFRIIVLGDSFSLCAGIEYEQIWTRLLETGLQKNLPRVEVFNLSVGGYNVVQHKLNLEEVGLALDPDLVLVALYPENDFSNSGYLKNERVARGLEEASTGTWYDGIYTWKVFLRPVIQRLGRLAGPPPDPQPKAQADDEWDQNVAALHRIAGIARERGILVEAVVLPSTWDFSGQQARFEKVRAALEDGEVPYLDLLDYFQESGVRERELHLNAIDAHPNNLYNSMVADRLTPRLSDVIAAAEQPVAPSIPVPSE